MDTQFAPYKFEIRINKANQRIVIIDDTLLSHNHSDIHYDDFDAVIYTTTNIKLLYRQFTVLCSPFTNNAFQFKPAFFNTSITERPLISSCDGLADDINAQIVIEETVRIQKRMADLDFKIYFSEPSFWNSDRQFYAFCRHCATRSNRLPEMEIVKGSPFGYLHPHLYVMLKGLELTPAVFLDVRIKLIEELKYMKLDDLVAIVHVCPNCFDKGLIYHETCPKCGSIDVKEQNMLHHFRCANISPEQSYMRDGTLICPKCLRELRHIGVDYDRPTTTYTCNKCSVNFSQARMVCECESCLTKSSIETLVPVALHNINITPIGIKMLASTNDFVESESVAKFSNVISCKQFKDILKVRIQIISNMPVGLSHVLRVYRAQVASSDALVERGVEMIARIYHALPNAMIAVNNNIIYVATESKMRLTEQEVIETTKTVLSDMPGILLGVDFIEYEQGLSVEQFIAKL